MLIGVRTNDPALVPRLRQHLAPDWSPARATYVDHLYSLRAAPPGQPGARTRQFNLLYSGAGRISRSLDLQEVLDDMEMDVHRHVAMRAPEQVFVHAGVVTWRGRALLLPGISHAGKSSLVAELVRLGAEYYSDEFAILDPEARVTPYAKRISLRVEGRPRPLLQRLGEPHSADAPVGLVAICRYREGARFRPRRLAPGAGVLALLKNTVTTRLRPADTLQTLSRVARDTPIIQSPRGEAADTAPRLLQYLESLP